VAKGLKEGCSKREYFATRSAGERAC